MSANPKLFSEHQYSKEYHTIVVFQGTRVLQTLAWEVIHRYSRGPEEFALFCIEKKSDMANLLDEESLGYEEQKVPTPGSNPILFGVADNKFIERFAEAAPKEYDRFLRHHTRPGFVICIICTSDAVEILDVKPNNFGHSQ